jgi:hypothetical protein
MKKFLIVLGIVILVLVLFVAIMVLLTPWMDRKGTTAEERTMKFAGDDLLKDPARIANRGITIKASPAKIFQWIVQISADKSGMYSYTGLERMMGIKMAKDETIHPEWQNLKQGDLLKMSDKEPAPPPYVVALVVPNESVVYGHQDNGKWVDLWEFRLIPQTDGSTRLIARTSTMMVGGFWEIIRPISFFMEQKMLATLKTLSEGSAR